MAVVLLLLACGGSIARSDDTVPSAQTEGAQPVSLPSEDTNSGRKWVDGRLESGLDAAWEEAGSDIALYQLLRLRILPPDAPKLRINTSLWLTEDLDGDEDRYSALYGIDDTYGGDVRLRVLEFNLEARDVLHGGTLRLGRQRILDGPLYNRIDGAHLRWDKTEWDLYAYAGTRASLYEDPFDDIVLGAGAGYKPTVNTRIGVDLFRGEDDRAGEAVRRGWLVSWLGLPYPRRIETHVEDLLLGLSLSQRFSEYHWLQAQLLLQDDGAHEYTMELSGLVEGWDLNYLLSYRYQFERVRDRVEDRSGYYRILGGYDPYHHIHAGIQRPIAEKLLLGIELDVHDAADSDHASVNRDYYRLAAVLSSRDLDRGLGFSVSLGYWEPSGRDTSWTLTGEVNKKWNAFEWGLGADYEQYRYEYVDYDPWPKWTKTAAILLLPGIYPGFSPWVWLNDTREILAREEIYAIYTRFGWKIDAKQRLSAKVTFETDDGPFAPYWRFRAAYELQF